ncbi:MAG: DUF4980 domain-containing protein [Muribaculaceae bacterium]|nr:DUF4980 domain-containing protein [Muribaculaceae bacterium]
MQHLTPFATGLLSLAASLQCMATDGVKVEHLGANNTLVRVNPSDARFLILPVEESVDDAAVGILLDGKQEKTINVRLARNKIDYYVPVDISDYKGKEILLNILTNHSSLPSERQISEDTCWDNISLSNDFDTSNTEKFRPAFHHTPLYGWMNDPNGMFYKDGVWHLYYQYNPYGSKWQNMSWGHSSSTDLLHWEHHPVVIEPDGLGQIFSGSCVVDSANTAGFGKDEVIALYTSAGANQMQSLAHSADNGESFVKYPGNPILTLDSEARDPNMFWNEASKEWVLILAHALEHEMLIFTSPDLKTWTLQSDFGKGLGAQGGVWECPDLFELPVDGSDEKKWVLICNLNPGGIFGGSAAQYFVGDFDGKTFKADTLPDGTVPTKWMDYGKDHYATVSWSGAPDDRRVVLGWMSNWQYADAVPTTQFRSANTLPRDLSLFIGADNQYYLKTLPSPEVNNLIGNKFLSAKNKNLGIKPASFKLPADNKGICMIEVDLDAQSSKDVEIILSNTAGEKVAMNFLPEESKFSFDRTQSGITEFSNEFPAVVWAPTLRNSKLQKLRIFIDTSSIEVFDAEGNFVMTNLVFPNQPYSSVAFSAKGGKARINSLNTYNIK